MKYNIGSYIRIFLQLIKVTVSLPVTFLSFISYVIYSGKIDFITWKCSLGVFMLSGAASALNQMMEQKRDKLMERTKNRPLPTGRITNSGVIIISGALIVAGIALLMKINTTCGVLGFFNLLWYLGVYTLLKTKTPFAVIPGSLIGAIPIMIGWAAAGGAIFHPLVIFISFFVFIWQIPHFWLLMMIYRQDYENAGYPTFFKIFDEYKARWWTIVWIISASLISMAFPFFKVINGPIPTISFVLLNISVISLSVFVLLFKPDKSKIRMMFHTINLFMISILILIAIYYKAVPA
jgi:protoheme IX farnesyltransferase